MPLLFLMLNALLPWYTSNQKLMNSLAFNAGNVKEKGRVIDFRSMNWKCWKTPSPGPL